MGAQANPKGGALYEAVAQHILAPGVSAGFNHIDLSNIWWGCGIMGLNPCGGRLYPLLAQEAINRAPIMNQQVLKLFKRRLLAGHGLQGFLAKHTIQLCLRLSSAGIVECFAVCIAQTCTPQIIIFLCMTSLTPVEHPSQPPRVLADAVHWGGRRAAQTCCGASPRST